jgi:kynureninase
VSAFDSSEARARRLDAEDPLAALRDRFHVPRDDDGTPRAYLCGNSLGLEPLAARAALEHELDEWARLGVDGHFQAARPWYRYHEPLRPALARLCGAEPSEVVAMNSLTVNLHLMLTSFYRPTPARHRVLLEAHAFPSDRYAVESQLRLHGHDPQEALLEDEDVERRVETDGASIAVVLLGAVSYFTGRWYDTARIAAAARRHGAVIGLDLAHAIGNVPLALHEQGIDFAVWCSYKYLNGGPGAPGGCFVHERHHERNELPRLAGWWGNDPRTRFGEEAQRAFVPIASADGWQLSNPSVLGLAPLVAACAVFEEVGIATLREKSERLTAYAAAWIEHAGSGTIEILTPDAPHARGCQLSLRTAGARELERSLRQAGVIGDYRAPDVVRVAPVPSYNTFHDVWRLGRAVERWAAERR